MSQCTQNNFKHKQQLRVNCAQTPSSSNPHANKTTQTNEQQSCISFCKLFFFPLLLLVLQTSLSKQLYLYANYCFPWHSVYLNLIRVIFIKTGQKDVRMASLPPLHLHYFSSHSTLLLIFLFH